MSNYYLRHANIDDIDFLYDLVNDADCRNNSFNSNAIEYSLHKVWFKEKLNSNKSQIYIYVNEDGKQIGQSRLDMDGYKANISYSIIKEFRGLGHGKIIVTLLEKEALDFPMIKELIAEVKFSNVASQKIFEQCEYIKISHNKYLEFIKKIR